MASKINEVAHLSVLLAKHKPDLSAYVCAKLAQELHSIGASIVSIATFECNGYKNDWQDAYINKISKRSIDDANAYVKKIQDDGIAYCEKRKNTIDKKIKKIIAEYGIDIRHAGLSGLIWQIDAIHEYYIGA